MMTQKCMQFWLKTMVDVYAQLSDDPPIIAVYDVKLRLPADVVGYLIGQGIIYKAGENIWFQYSKGLNIPVTEI